MAAEEFRHHPCVLGNNLPSFPPPWPKDAVAGYFDDQPEIPPASPQVDAMSYMAGQARGLEMSRETITEMAAAYKASIGEVGNLYSKTVTDLLNRVTFIETRVIFLAAGAASIAVAGVLLRIIGAF